MNWRNLMDTARELAGQTQPPPRGRPRQESLKRAVSSAYYAMFHALCRSNADTLVGARNDGTGRLAWIRTYRALDHRQAKNRLAQVRREVPVPARNFAAAFTTLQEKRQEADYNPHSTFTRREVTDLLDAADATIQEYLRMPRSQLRAVAALVLMQSHPGI